MLPCMTIARYFVICLILSLLPSCALVQSVLKIPASILKTAGRTVGVSRLTDEAPKPVTEHQEMPVANKPKPAAPAE